MQIPTPRGSLLARFLAIVLVLHSCPFLSVLASQTGKQKITIVASDVTLDNVFKQIEKQTGLRFIFAIEAVDVNEKVTVSFKKTVLDDVLTALLGGKGIVWQYREGTISLKRESIVAKPVNAFAQGIPVGEPSFTVSGKVLDAKGDPIPGATVIVKGAKKGAKTDGDGNFVLAGVELNAVLLVSSIGFATKEVKIVLGLNVSSLIIRMNEVVSDLDVAVIIGYGTTTQRFNTGSVASVKAEDIAKQPVTDPLLTLQGRMPGVMITETTGVQGGQVKVQIRGQNSLISGTQPLFIVDGIPYAPSITGLTGFGAMGGNTISALNFINPADIESIDVLKDADATAIYGSRGANGVVLITTKKGKTGTSKVDINIYKGWADVAHMRKMLNTSQYLEMRREAFKNDGATPNVFNAPDLLVWDTTRYTDWQKTLIGGTAHYTDAQASVSGGNSSVGYLISGNYHKQTTVFPGDFSSQNGGAHFNITANSPNQRLKTIFTGSYTIRNTKFPNGSYLGSLDLPPNAPPVYNADGTLNWANSTWANPYATAFLRAVLDQRSNNLLGSIDVSYRLLPGLVVKANLGCNELRSNAFLGSPIASFNPQSRIPPTASAVYSDNKTTSWIFEPQVTYAGTIGKGELNILAGATVLGNNADARRLITSGIKDDALIRNPASASATGYAATATGSKYKYAAVFGRIGYNLQAKYLLNLTIRRDGSSRFGPRKQFATFGAIGAGWLFSQESFIKSALPFLSYGKLRASYGTTGNDQIGDYRYLDAYEYEEASYQGIKGLRVFGLFNADFSWELTRKMEAALETGFFKDRVLLTTSYYRNRSFNQLINYPLPSIVGAGAVLGNQPAVIQNAGWEFLLTTKNVQTRYFEWSTAFNISIGRNKLVSYSGNGNIYARIGGSLSETQTYRVLGTDPETGSFQFANQEGKGGPSYEAVQDFTVKLAPAYFGGFQNSFRYKGFSLDVFFQYVKQQGNSGLFSGYVPGIMKNQPANVLSRWQYPGDITDMQRFSQDGSLSEDYSAFLNSNRVYADASFIRCKNLSFSWYLPDGWKQKMHMNSCRIYIQGQNLFTITRYPGWDPETQSISAIPPLRVITIGCQLIL